jgi:hypothetical protein
MADCPEKEMIGLILSMFHSSGGIRGELFAKLTGEEQTVLRSIVFSDLFFNSDSISCQAQPVSEPCQCP